ncbi:hypothetical protein [Tepidicella baoligensis]|uniref:hypothetical protein n=1 Tax=Tepidicella baoligensis TaxID=2707016 RepID=UPI0015DA1E46|nr:hypothetical protein [Tepidicella baoligensis]
MIRARILKIAFVAAGVALLAACGEVPQDLNTAAVKPGTPAYQGVGASQFAERGWQPGDRTSWEQQLRARAAYGQNEYTRVH